MPEHGVEKDQAEDLRISIGSLKEAIPEEDPLKSNRALSRLLEQEREELSPIGIEEVCFCMVQLKYRRLIFDS